MKRKISKNISWKRFIFAPLMVILPFLILMQGAISLDKIIGALISFSFLAFFFYINNLPKTISFDYEFMYIERKSNEEIIALEEIQIIEKTTTKLSRNSLWKISYMDKNKALKYVLMMPKTFDEHFDEFIHDVKALNKNVKIKS